MHLAPRALLLVLACGTAIAQAPVADPIATLQHRDLTIWFVAQPTPPPQAQPYTQHREVTAGSFGRPASTVGHAASDVGVSPSNMGPNVTAGSKSAGDVGQTAGSFGTASSNIGQTAGSYGQSASSLGTPESPAATPAFAEPTLDWIPTTSNQLSNSWRATLAMLHRAIPNREPHVAFVKFEDVQDRLAATEGTRDYPDVLIGAPLRPARGLPRVQEATLAHLGQPFSRPGTVFGDHQPQPADTVILKRAPHPLQARAFVVWLSEEVCPGCWRTPVEPGAEAPSRLAVSAAETLLHGGGITDADPAFANPLNPSAVTLGAFRPGSDNTLNGLALHSDVLGASANERFAVVALRTLAESAQGFGVLHPLVVLRTGPDGHWRVLQVTTNLDFDLLGSAYGALASGAIRLSPARLKPVSAVTQAAPVDGDTRSLSPELWWDDPGDAPLLVVESQRSAGSDTWTDSHLQTIPDHGSRLQVRVTAEFADTPGSFRWRVWSVGTGGVLAFSPWRRLTITP